MTKTDTMLRSDRYSRVAIAFHWALALLVLTNLTIGLFHDGMPRAWGVMPIHKSIGITVLVLTLARLGWRLMNPAPAQATTLSAWERTASRAMHWAFYALLLVMPLSGWAMSSFSKTGTPRPLTWFNLFDIPYLPVTGEVAGVGHEAHEILGWTMAALVVIHVLAALRHHFILRDSTLHRMLPILNAPKAS
jgi:cytochrome b561